MITLSAADLNAWIAAFIFPASRILALISSAPIWGSAAIPRRTRLILGLAITFAIMPALPPMPSAAPGSVVGLWLIAQQILIGLGMGFAMRVVYTALDVAGEYIGLQMGLGFATFYDPQHGGQTPVIAEFLGLLAILVFLSLNGHLLYVATLAQSFVAIPVSVTPLGSGSWLNLVELGAKMFSGGLLLALPVLVALTITNVALGVLTRAAPQLNLFAVGFPLTLAGGFAILGLMLNYLATPLQDIFEAGISAMLAYPVSR